jgi:hypothetical protein
MPVVLIALQAALTLIPEVAAVWPTIEALLGDPTATPTPHQLADLWAAVEAAHARAQGETQ